MKDLILVAASGLAREALAAVRATGSHRPVGFLDDDQELTGRSIAGLPVLGGVARIVDHPGAEVVLCVGRGAGRERLAERLGALGVAGDRYASIVHPSVHVPPSCHVGRGSIVLAQVAMTADVRLGRHVVVMPNVTLTHDDAVEDFATIAAGVALGGVVSVGTRAYLGMNSSVRERVSVGPDAVLGMGAALVTDLPARQTWVGVPARPAVQGKERHGAWRSHEHEQTSTVKGTSR